MNMYLETINRCILETEPKWEFSVSSLVDIISKARTDGKKIFFIGNGGSAGIALHMAADFQKTLRIKTQTFYDPSLLTCMANDYGYENVFSIPLSLHMNEGDILIAISSSGESCNIINTIPIAKEKGGVVVSFSGFQQDNTLRRNSDFSVYVPINDYGIVETLHNMMLQQIVDFLKDNNNAKE